MPEAVDIVFYINLGLVLCVLIECAANIVILKKTAFSWIAGMSSVILFGIGIILFTVQLVMHSLGVENAFYAVYLALSEMYAGLIFSGVYAILMYRRAHSVECILAGIFAFIPPIGTIFTIVLLVDTRFDTDTQSIVYNGYAYTFGALSGFVGAFKPELIDTAEAGDFEPLCNKDRKQLLKKLKGATDTPEGQFKYGEALLHYEPKSINKAVRFISRAASGNYPPAVFNLGYFYETGIGVKRDPKRAKDLYGRAAELGDKDAPLRLRIVAVREGKNSDGAEVFRELMESDSYAMYDYAICLERGIGTAVNLDEALELYYKCIGLLVAQKRIVALAAAEICAEVKNEPSVVDFIKLTNREYSGEFKHIIDGMTALRNKLAADAAQCFLNAVKARGKWEGFARCMVGALYIDCGAKQRDINNGVAYVRSALPLTPLAKDILASLPKKLLVSK